MRGRGEMNLELKEWKVELYGHLRKSVGGKLERVWKRMPKDAVTRPGEGEGGISPFTKGRKGVPKNKETGNLGEREAASNRGAPFTKGNRS